MGFESTTYLSWDVRCATTALNCLFCFHFKLLHDIANEKLDDLAADIENQAIDHETFKGRKREIKANIKNALGALPCLESFLNEVTLEERRDYKVIKNDLEAIQYKFLDIKFQ